MAGQSPGAPVRSGPRCVSDNLGAVTFSPPCPLVRG